MSVPRPDRNSRTETGAVQAKRHRSLHRHGRDGRGQRAPGRRRRHHPYGGGPAGHARAESRARTRAAKALERERLGYTEALGMPALRERIARFMGERYGVAVSPERVVVTSGSSAGFVLAFLVLLDQGDALGLPSPGYPCYRQILKALGIEPAAGGDLGAGPVDADRCRRRPASGRGRCRPPARQPQQSDRHHGAVATARRACAKPAGSMASG